MERRTNAKSSKGITLIALVISIIIMLILAGVSINAVVGDNGILGKATDAVYLQSAAVLEEYFNQLYAEGAIDGNEEGETPLDTIMKNGYQDYFFKTSEGYCLKKPYTNPNTGEVQTLVLYLVKKEQLPEEIRKQIKGADNLESRDYRKLNGVYGITSDLKAYYCQSGIDSMLGLTTSDLNADSPDIVYADESSTLAQIINGGTAPITNQGLKSIKTLTIDSTEKLTILPEFSKFINLTTVYFQNITIESLAGIEGASKINYLKFTSCNVQDYSAINGLTELTQLYLVSPVGKNEEIVRLGSVDRGIASGEFRKLQYFGIVGYDYYLNSTSTDYSGTRYDVTDISSLSNFNETTKKAIKYMNLQNLQLTSISALADFTNVYLMRLEENALTTLDGIQNMSGLKYLIAPCQYSNATASYTLGINEGDTASDTDALKYIYKDNNANTILYYVDLRNNTNLKYVDSLGQCSGIRYLYLAGCSKLQNANTIGTVLGNCGSKYSINGSYGLEIISDTTTVLSLAGKTMTISEFEQLKNRSNLTHLNLQGIVITDNSGNQLSKTTTPTFNDEVNNVLKTCVNLKYLRLYGLSNLTTIDFVGNGKCTKLIELDLTGTSVINLVSLNEYAKNLNTLILDNTGIDLTTIQPTISRSGGGRYWESQYAGTILKKWALIKQIENCTDITKFYNYYPVTGETNGKILDLSKTKCTSISLTWYWCQIIYPKTIQSIHNDYCNVPIFVEGTDKLTSLSLHWNRTVSGVEQWEDSIKSMANVNNLNSLTITNAKNFKFEFLQYLSELKYLENFAYSQSGDSGSYGKGVINIDGIGNLKYLKSLSINNCIDLEDISDITDCKNLNTLNINSNPKLANISSLSELLNLSQINLSNNKINDISALNSLVNLTNVNLENNMISDIHPLINCTKLETLNIQNNALNDFSYYKDESGRSVGYEVMDVFYDLNYTKKGALKNLYISGNTFDDTEILLDLPWDAKSGF